MNAAEAPGALPIAFSQPMVQALHAGRKLQTRRVVRLPAWAQGAIELDDKGWPMAVCKATGCMAPLRSPYGAAGGLLWVREAVHRAPLENFLTGEPTNAMCIYYTADGAEACDPAGFNLGWTWRVAKLAPRYMPRYLARTLLQVASVRAERLQAISEEDAQAEGADEAAESTADDERLRSECGYYPPRSYVHGYSLLWDNINGSGSWALDPLVWRVEFAVLHHQKEDDQ